MMGNVHYIVVYRDFRDEMDQRSDKFDTMEEALRHVEYIHSFYPNFPVFLQIEKTEVVYFE